MFAAFAVAAQLAIVAHAPDSVSACDAVEITVSVSAKGLVVPRLAIPSLAPFDVLRGGATPRLEFTRATTYAEYRFILTTAETGTFTIPPFVATEGAERAATRPIPIVVRALRGRSAPSVIARARIDTSPEVNLRSAAAAETLYVGQQATYEVAVFLNQAVRERLKRNPTFYPPEMQATLAYDLPAPPPASRRSVKGGSQCFDALVYRRALFPLVAGRLAIPPAQLVYSTGFAPLSAVRSEESHELQTDSVTIVAIEPPLAGRPREYTGAIGDLRVDARLDSSVPRVGDPMLYTVRVSGTGNVKLFPRPAVGIPWAGLVPADERVRVDSSSARVGGAKEFDWVLTPRIAGEFDLPPVRYGYFDPARRRYDVATTPAQRVRVGAGALANADTSHTEGVLSIRTRYTGTSWPAPQSRPEFWLVMAIAPLPVLATRMRRRPRRVAAAPADDPIKALATSPVTDPVALRRHYVRVLAARLGCNPEDFTHPGALLRALQRAGVSDGTAERAEAMLRELDSAAYSPGGTLPTSAARDATHLARAVDIEALARRELPFWIPMILAAVCVFGAASAMAADRAETLFARGVSAYLRQDYSAARDAFADAAAAAPMSADAWANFGTAAWTVNDTASAVLGWRQGLALEPNAEDLQDRVSSFRDLGPLSPGWVPQLPRNATVWLFALLWLAAWSLAWLPRRGNPWVARLPLPIAACALVVGLVAIELESSIAGGKLAVVRRAVTVSSDPAIGMDRGPTVGTGEIVRLVGRRGTWSRVEASDDRDGWVASSQLLFLSDRRPPRD